MIRRGPLKAGEKVQLTDRKGKMVTIQLTAGGHTGTEHGEIEHDDIIGQPEGSVIVTRTVAPRKSDLTAAQAHELNPRKPWKGTRRIGGWSYTVMRPRLEDFVMSMPRGAQIMFPKDIARAVELADIRPGMRVLESGGGSGAMSLHLLEAVGEMGNLTTIEARDEFARICLANAHVFYGFAPQWWSMRVGLFDDVAATLPEHSFDRIILDMLDPWNRLTQAHRVIVPGGVLVAYVTTTTQLSRIAEALRNAECWTEPEISETIERTWKVEGLAVRPNHQMVGHTGFLLVTRAMADGFTALRVKERATKDVYTDVDSLESLELRDISDQKVRKVLRDLDAQIAAATPPYDRNVDGDETSEENDDGER